MAQITSQYREWTGRRLRALMRALDLSTAQVAARLGVHQRTVEVWLSDKRKPLPAFRETLRQMENEAK